MTRLISPQAAAELLGFNEKTVRRMLNRGDLPGVKVGGRWRLDPHTLPDWGKEAPAPPQQTFGQSRAEVLSSIELDLYADLARPCPIEGWGTVYIATDGELTKVGFTTRNVHQRINEISIGRVRPMTLVDWIPAVTIDLERMIHRRLHPYRVQGDWYRVTTARAVKTAWRTLTLWERELDT